MLTFIAFFVFAAVPAFIVFAAITFLDSFFELRLAPDGTGIIGGAAGVVAAFVGFIMVMDMSRYGYTLPHLFLVMAGVPLFLFVFTLTVYGSGILVGGWATRLGARAHEARMERDFDRNPE